MKMMMMMEMPPRRTPSNLHGIVSIAFLPFWCFDAKGGEMVLVGYPRDLHGSGTSICFYHFLRACVHLSFVVLNLVLSVELHLLYLLLLCVDVDLRVFYSYEDMILDIIYG